MAYEQNGNGYSPCVEDGITDCPMPDENWGKLIALVGFNDPFPVGTQNTFTATSDGTLELRMNEKDSWLYNNSGVLAVVVGVEHP